MKYTTVSSSMVDVIGYDAEHMLLEARFADSGLTYAYEGVPPEVYEALMSAASLGSYMTDHIIDRYPYYKVGRRRRR